MESIRALSAKVTFSNGKLIQHMNQNIRACHVAVQDSISSTIRSKFASVSEAKLPNGKSAVMLQNRLLTDGLSSAKITQNLAVTRPYSVLPQRAIYTTPLWQHGNSDIARDRKCWNCGRETDALKELFFCECGVVQSPATEVTYFTLFNMDETFNVDLKALGEVYKYLQKHLHPDMYSQKTETEQQLAEQQSALLNKAYFTLLKPLPRALYILNLHGLSVYEDSTDKFLTEILDINERIGEATADDIQVIEKEINMTIDNSIELLQQAFFKKEYAEARDIAVRLKYYVNLESKVKTFYRDRM